MLYEMRSEIRKWTCIPIRQLLLEKVIAHKTHTSLDRVAHSECSTSRIEPYDTLIFDGVTENCDWALFLEDLEVERMKQ
jgi:hypothetical protein